LGPQRDWSKVSGSQDFLESAEMYGKIIIRQDLLLDSCVGFLLSFSHSLFSELHMRRKTIRENTLLGGQIGGSKVAVACCFVSVLLFSFVLFGAVFARWSVVQAGA
jgi:hypothetical protein